MKAKLMEQRKDCKKVSEQVDSRIVAWGLRSLKDLDASDVDEDNLSSQTSD